MLDVRRANRESALADLVRKVNGLEEKLADNRRQWVELVNLLAQQTESLRTLAIESNQDRGKIVSKLNHVVHELDFIRNRQAAFLGDHLSLTYLNDRTPIVVDSTDPGPAAVVLNGGAYEPNNVEIILSFVKPDTVFLDVGANIGIFSLKVAVRLDGRGRVYAFEPQENLVKAIRRSAALNGVGALDGVGKVNCYALGVSDRNGDVGFIIPPSGHLGGARVVESGAVDHIRIVRLDDFLTADFRCDLVKMDIEGHELFALRGMERIIANSPNVKILFEKAGKRPQRDADLEAFFEKQDMDLFSVGPNATLVPLVRGELAARSGNMFAAKRGDRDLEDLYRGRFFIYARQLFLSDTQKFVGERLVASASRGKVLFYGPYWFLRAGRYKLRIHGEVNGSLGLTITRLGGQPIATVAMAKGAKEGTFVTDLDAMSFECVARAASDQASVTVERIEVIRL